ncbi:MAG: CHAT domain-containing protein [Chitinophagaceae bacterium]|nr:CHAT domain-containing protein [Chitinophagaceae bacterium]
MSGTLSSSSNNEEKNEALKKLLAMQQSKKALESTLEKQEGSAKEETLKKIEIVEANYNNFLEDVVGKYPELSIYFSRSNADEFNNYKSKLPEDVAVLLYLLNNNTLMIFSLTREKLSVDTMTVDIGPAVNTFIEAIKNTSKQTGTGPLALRSEPVDEDNTAAVVEFKDLSGHLYKTLISTVLDKISGKKKLCIIPTGVFSNLPFQCLGEKTAGNKFRFLIEDHNIFYTNKMSVFNSGEKEIAVKTGLQSFAAFGVPDATLQFNIGEVKEIGKILGSDSTVYADARATESLAKISLRQKKYIHFATHGVLNYSSDYSQSYLKLLPDKDTSNGNNGQLTMREIQSLGITDCNMVILSACQTAVSKQLVKGWNISPANSFLVSNVKTVVASLWKVADEPTGLLMQYFYENLSLPVPMEKAEALRQAQVKLSQSPRFNHTNYWGAFVLYGDWR